MKILFLSNIPTPNQLDFVQEANKYIDMKYVVLYPTEVGRDWNLTQIPEMTILYFKKSFKTYSTYYRLYKKFDPDMVIVGGYALPLGFFSYIISKYQKTKFIYWLEKPNKTTKVKIVLKYLYMKMKFFFIRPDVTLAIGREPANFYKKYFNKVENFPYSMDLTNYYAGERSQHSEKIKFLFCGQLIKRKNIINVIEAFLQINNPQIELNILGSGELQSDIEKMKKEDSRINILGFIEPENIYQVYQNNDIFILPSLDDGWALVINEAMASGMPIIGTNEVGAIEEFIVHKENGYVCDIDSNSIKKGIEYYIQNPNLIYEHGMKNREIIKSSLADVTNSVPRLKKIAESLN